MYERARTALVAQLRSVNPPLSENDVTRERLALEESIRKVEAEAARKTWVEPVNGAAHDARSRAGIPALGSAAAQRAGARTRSSRAPRRSRIASRGGAATAHVVRTANASAAQPRAEPVNGGRPARPPDRRGAYRRPCTGAMLGEQRYVDPVFDQPLASEQAPNIRRGRSPRALRSSRTAARCSTAALKDFREVVSEPAKTTSRFRAL